MTNIHRIAGIAMVIFAGSLFNAPVTYAAGEFEIRKHFVKFDGERLYRKNSQEISLGDYGPKETSVAGANGLARKGHFRDLLSGNWDVTQPISTKGSHGHQTKFAKGITSFGEFLGLSESMTSQLLRQNRCRFRGVNVKGIDRFVDSLNNNSSELDKIRGNKRRVVTGVLVVESCELTETMARKIKGKVKLPIKNLILNANVFDNKRGTTDIVLAKGSILGYELSKPVWEKKLKKKTSNLKTLKVDSHGL